MGVHSLATSVIIMRGVVGILLCLALLSMTVEAKKPSKGKPNKPKPIKPVKPSKPATVKPPKPATVMPPKPEESEEFVSANEKFDDNAHKSLPGCLNCLKHATMYECIEPCFSPKEEPTPAKCLICVMEKAPMCVAPCGFTNLANEGAFPPPQGPQNPNDPCIQHGQGILPKPTTDENNNVDMVIPGVQSAYECGVKCGQPLPLKQWTYYNKYAASETDRFMCYCLNEKSIGAEIMPRFDMATGFPGCPPTVATVAPTVAPIG